MPETMPLLISSDKEDVWKFSAKELLAQVKDQVAWRDF
jgi:hypothetical protein